MSNVAFHYMYRDGSNCKRPGVVIFTNRADLPVDVLYATITQHLDDGCYFIASQIGIPEVFFWMTEPQYEITENDHGWHEFTDIRSTPQPPTDPRDIEEFLAELEQVDVDPGWHESRMAGCINTAPYTHQQKDRRLTIGDPAILTTTHTHRRPYETVAVDPHPDGHSHEHSPRLR